ncbi:MAG: MazE family transcriptional regulator [Spirochaetes bacterium]|nr:MAG: MazE family transcriptional regulator [Spirochaetota bacterium]
MIKQLQRIGNSRGIIIDRAILDLLNVPEDSSFEVTQEKGGLFLRPLSVKDAYEKVAGKHRKSLDKLAK